MTLAIFEARAAYIKKIRGGLILGVVVFAASMLGILTRVEGSFAAFWPANPIVLGIMIRFPQLSSLRTWIAAFAGYMAADLLAGGSYTVALWLSCANLVGVLVGFLLFQRLPDTDRSLKRPLSIVWLFTICLISAAVSALAGAGVGHAMLGRHFTAGLAFWFTTELVNSIILLPVILTTPTAKRTLLHITELTKTRWDAKTFLPVLALLGLMCTSMMVGRPGSFAYPIPALLWCAMTYGLFATTILTLCFSIWAISAISAGILPFLMGDDPLMSMMSQRLAIALIALGPLTVASINTMKDELLRRLEYSVNHDFLTQALSRGALMKSANDLLARNDETNGFFCVLMLDIDNFKAINDKYGHAAGDCVLVAFSDVVAGELGSDDLFGRLGGEEFKLVFTTHNPGDAKMAAENIRSKTETLILRTGDGTIPNITVSGGLVIRLPMCREPLDNLFAIADKCLYQAKSAGKNRIVTSPS
ncbi:diguanylate cyclase (GGDEF)-like protein [Phyllobacterium trifolii]|uniref:diguanylate cyclase n=1 Tax=Phyllobacterium trifolii TaxID=300193 RepID=A0A839UDT6_9HYPH|nr:GGDEF domain-containing protein [Phyllobacterium trifolii]MBB3149248.1 diguanylate cyclase (GGDEF)-like protein [Phyllobacterium trifolii]